MWMPPDDVVCWFCDSEDVYLLSSDDGIDIHRCAECGEVFENDTYVPHPPPHDVRKVRKMPSLHDDD
jgi:Zn ribbon nucleic-acid-binding protein